VFRVRGVYILGFKHAGGDGIAVELPTSIVLIILTPRSTTS
jgi:hypothetical protein